MESIFFERLKKDPENPRHMLSMAEVYLFKRDNRRAYSLVNAAVSKDPKNIPARELRIEVFRQLGLPKLALAEIRTILDMDPGNWKSKIIEISTLMQLGKVEEAGALVQELSTQAIPKQHELDFTFAKTTYLKDKGDYEDLQTFLDEIKPRFPGQPGVDFEQAWLYMANGKFESGFALFESRFARGLHYYPLEPYLANSKIPKLNPQLCKELRLSQSVLVTCEEGFGDAIQFWRYLPQLKQLGVHVTLCAGAPLAQLFQENYPDIAFISKEEMRLTLLSAQKLPYDAYVEIMSLPHVLGIAYLPIDASPYLKPNPQRVQAMQAMLDERFPKKRFRLGLRWQREGAGSPRCVDLKLLAPLADLPIDIVSLHYGSPTEKDSKIISAWDNFMHTNLNFVDLPAMMSQLDCVLSVDTVTTHVAGAIGHPTIAMIPTFINWRWGRDIPFSPWYENQMIIRQSRYQSWEDVAEQAIAEIQRRIALYS
jgi:ADP-heptose:LPS heptosyltransferase/thioredoxin-like negative regulator of GroEL